VLIETNVTATVREKAADAGRQDHTGIVYLIAENRSSKVGIVETLAEFNITEKKDYRNKHRRNKDARYE
jgi:hypothetical protein